MLELDAPGTVIAELERQSRMNEDILRFLTIRVDELEAGPTVMMRKNERSERGGRGRDGGSRDGGSRNNDNYGGGE